MAENMLGASAVTCSGRYSSPLHFIPSPHIAPWENFNTIQLQNVFECLVFVCVQCLLKLGSVIVHNLQDPPYSSPFFYLYRQCQCQCLTKKQTGCEHASPADI